MKALIAIPALLLSIFLLSPQVAIAQTDPLEELCRQNPGAPACQDRDTGQDAANNRVVDVLTFVVNTFSWVIGIAGVIAVIVGGIMYAVSGGDPQKTNQAKNTIIYALVGLVIAAFAQLIIFLVLDRLNI